MNGLVLFDYDGTLVDERDGILTPTHKTKQAVSMLQDQGYLCVLATGRALSYIPKGAKDLYLDGYITSNGACVSVHGKEILHDTFADEELRECILDFEQHDINYVLENKEACYVHDLKESEFLHFLDYFHTPKENYVAYQGFAEVAGKIEKITLAFKDHDAMLAYGAHIQDRYEVSYHRNCNTFDIAKKHISKGSGVQALIKHCHIPWEHTYAFGDGDNDVEMMKSVAYPIAMGIHDEKLKPYAYMVTDTVKEEGIYKALKKLEVI